MMLSASSRRPAPQLQVPLVARPRNQIYPRGFAPRTPLHALSLQPSLVLSLRRRLALVRVRSLTAFARVVIRGTVLASLRSLAAGTVGGWVRFASLARDLLAAGALGLHTVTRR